MNVSDLLSMLEKDDTKENREKLFEVLDDFWINASLGEFSGSDSLYYMSGRAIRMLYDYRRRYENGEEYIGILIDQGLIDLLNARLKIIIGRDTLTGRNP